MLFSLSFNVRLEKLVCKFNGNHGLFRLTKASLVVSNGGLWDDIIPLHSLLPVYPALLQTSWIMFQCPNKMIGHVIPITSVISHKITRRTPVIFTRFHRRISQTDIHVLNWTSHTFVGWHFEPRLASSFRTCRTETECQEWPKGHKVKFKEGPSVLLITACNLR